MKQFSTTLASYNSTALLQNLIKRYRQKFQPITVSFREIVDWLATPDRLTHQLHPYPAKLLMHIPNFFLSNDCISKRGDLVLDPFCGSGTVLLEAMASGRSFCAADANPLSRMIATTKTTYIPPTKLEKYATRIINLYNENINDKSLIPPPVINVSHWYYPHVIRQLTALYHSVKQIKLKEIRDFYLICFSNCARKVSLADPRLSVPVRLKENKYPEDHWLHNKTKKLLANQRRTNVINVFMSIVNDNINRIETLSSYQIAEQSNILIDARRLVAASPGEIGIQPESVQLIITSPPYAGAQKYIRSLSLSLGWLGFTPDLSLKALKTSIIGREEYRKDEIVDLVDTEIREANSILRSIAKKNKERAHIAGNYLIEMRDAIHEMNRVLKPNGYVVLVVGNNHVCGSTFKTADYLKQYCLMQGWELVLALQDHIRSRGLMTKRNKTANIINSEMVMLFKKGTYNGY